ncbi:V-type proton ATPase subunit F [Cinnamomum micranthum f. kanehirae]|uniref:V-type proton ATPase subunit F n=1 Tax=Cinnamomum micranthum f. kanehirae TaxID=337451 RepID=A0A3S3NPC7_9MAGN|nr:V-type proton ATPase subunit F [Cinnamomum micranthum f. kanehirae]
MRAQYSTRKVQIISLSRELRNFHIHLREKEEEYLIQTLLPETYREKYSFYYGQQSSGLEVSTLTSLALSFGWSEYLLALDTVTGFLLAGVGNVDLRRKTNYLIVDSTAINDFGSTRIIQLFGAIPYAYDAFNCCLARNLHSCGFVFQILKLKFTGAYLLVFNKIPHVSETTVKQIEDAFKEFTTKEDIAIVLISQYVANMIRFLVDSYNNPVPAILEIPSKDHPYDPTHDSVLSRVRYLFNTESVASGRR